jgi:hypothetical protein
MRIRLLLVLVAAMIVASILASCGGNPACTTFDCSPIPGADASDTGPKMPDEDAAFRVDGSGGDGSACGKTCSSDLHQVLDCNGTVLQTCPPTQGCAPDGTCIPACDAAKAHKSSVGCDYFAMNPIFFSGGSCFATFVANTWGAPVKVSVERGGTTYNVASFGFLAQGSGTSITYAPLTNGTIPPNEVGILLLNKDGGLGCPGNLATATTGAAPTGTGIGNAFHVTTDAPVVAYDIYPFGGGSTAVASATLLLPTSVWSDNYVATAAYGSGFGTGPWIAATAMEDGTEVTILPPVPIVGGGGLAPGPQNVATKYTLQKGQFALFTQTGDLSGAPIQSNKPIGVWGGIPCANLEQPACDGMHQQIPPVKALASEYVAVRYRNRVPNLDESPPWRIMGTVDGTTLTYDPPVATGPTTLSRGQVVEFKEGKPFVVKSQDAQHPFYLGGHMTGCFVIGGYGSPVGCAGDPEFVNVIPPAQYLAEYVFFTDPTYPETHLVFTRSKAKDGTFKDVTLDCMGTLTGWQPVGSSGNYEYVRVDIATGNFQKVGTCDNGRHVAKSAGGFGLTVWGWGTNATSSMSQACSYAYPAGAGVVPINTVVVPPTPK